MNLLPKQMFFLFFCFSLTACFNFSDLQQTKKTVKKESILVLNIKGVITSELAENFMKNVRDYAGKKKIKGVLIRVNSPGGAVGSSQEINSAIREIREFYKKPVFVTGGDIVASGGVYASMSADKIFLNKGTLFGSIGVIMTFKNLSEIVRWAKLEIYHLKAGEFKDIGSPYREMTLRERELFENLLEDTLDQFKRAIVEGRKLDPKVVENFSDGRIFSAEEALELGVVDALGSFNQALKALGEETGLGSTPTLFDPGAKTPFERALENFGGKSFVFEAFVDKFLSIDKLAGQPLYILPSHILHH